MLELEQALERMFGVMPPPRDQRISTGDADGRILRERVIARLDLPPFDNSAMDGYAVRAEDTTGASSETPVRLRVVGKVTAGQATAGSLGLRESIRVFTGSPIPKGADAVVMQEDTTADFNSTTHVLICAQAETGESIRRRGEDITAGTTLLEPGEILGAAHIAVLGAMGVEGVIVGVRPVVGLLATGSELREPGTALEPGQIYESNRAALAALVNAAGGVSKMYAIVPDEPGATRRSLETAFAECDLVVSSGGVSVGDMDFVKRAFEETGGDLDFWRVAIKPGRPFMFGRRENKFLFGLPGNPVSAFITFLLLVRPLLLRWQGAKDTGLFRHAAVLAEPIANPGDRRHFVRVQLNSSGRVHSAGLQASHALSSLAAANGLLELAPQSSRSAGDVVEVLRWTLA